MKKLRLIALIALLAPPALAQPFDSLALAQGRQPSGTPSTLGTPGTLTLRGVVVTASDVPLPRVHVGVVSAQSQQLAAAGLSPRSERGVLTDDRGLFTITVPATGPVRLAFTKA